VPWGSYHHVVSQDGQWVYGLNSAADGIYRAPTSDPSSRTILASYNEEFVGEVVVDTAGNVAVVSIRFVSSGGNNAYRIDKIDTNGVVTTIFPELPTNQIVKMFQRWDNPDRAYVLHTETWWGDIHIYDMEISTGSYTEVHTIPAGTLPHAMGSTGWQTGTDGSLWYNGYHTTEWGSSLSVWRWDPVTFEINNAMTNIGGRNLGGHYYDMYYCQLIPLDDGKMGMIFHDDYWNSNFTVGGVITHNGGDDFTVVYQRGLNYQ
jgi:hypothetical protein